jgi:hypothetical protein
VRSDKAERKQEQHLQLVVLNDHSSEMAAVEKEDQTAQNTN